MLPSEQHILDLVKHYRHEIGLDNYLIVVHFSGETKHRASTESDPVYLELDVWFDLTAMAARGDDVELTVLHELLHAPMRALTDLIDDHLEQADDTTKKQFNDAQEAATTRYERMPVWRYVRQTPPSVLDQDRIILLPS